MKLIIEKSSLDDIKEKSEIIGMKPDNYMVAVFLYYFSDLTGVAEDYDAPEKFYEIMESMNVGEDRKGVIAKEMSELEIPEMPESITREFTLVSGAYGTTSEILMSDFVNALYGFEGSPQFERFGRLMAGFWRLSDVRLTPA